jgi:hypothetical protein
MKKLGIVAYVRHPSYSGRHKQEACSPGQPRIKQDPISKITKKQKELEAWLMLPTKCESVSSTPPVLLKKHGTGLIGESERD